MEHPEGFPVRREEEKVVNLKKILYGLKQAAHGWNDRYMVFVTTLGFEQLNGEPLLFVRESGDSYVIIAVYVDDQLIEEPNIREIEEL